MASFAGVTFTALRVNGDVPMPSVSGSPVVITEMAGGNRFIATGRPKAMTVIWTIRFANHTAYAAFMNRIGTQGTLIVRDRTYANATLLTMGEARRSPAGRYVVPGVTFTIGGYG